MEELQPVFLLDQAQENIIVSTIDRINTGISGKILINAGPGSGKTTTLLELCRRLPTHINAIMLVYNVEVAKELKSRTNKSKNITALTVDSYAASFSRKTVILNDNREIICQGYEPEWLEYTQNIEGILPEDIKVGYTEWQVTFTYQNPEKNKESRYYPDGFITSANAVVEVKSEYTYFSVEAQNLAKFSAVNSAGYDLWLYVFNNKKQLIFKRIFYSDGTDEYVTGCMISNSVTSRFCTVL
jgi:NADH:ubiquinone oxidoreductase subunit